MTVGQITEKSTQQRIETVLLIVLKFLIDRACFYKGRASANFGVVTSWITNAHLDLVLINRRVITKAHAESKPSMHNFT